MAAPARDNAVVHTLEESWASFDRMANEWLNMSGEEFLRLLDSGIWDEVIDDPEYRNHLHLAMKADFLRAGTA